MTSKSKVRDGDLSDADLLWLFVDLVGEYDRLCEAFPVAIGADEVIDRPIPEIERWHRIVRTLVVRKFLTADQDALRVDRVIEAYENCVLEKDPAADGLLREFVSITKVHEDSIEVFEDVLYGELFHGEYARHQRNLARPQSEIDIAVWKVGESAELLVRKVRTSILVAARDANLNHEATASINRPATTQH